MDVSAADVKIPVDGKEISGYLAKPDQGGHGYDAGASGGQHAGVIVIQEWWGVNNHIKDIVRRLAAEGFVALAPDLYDGKVTKDPAEAGALMQALNESVAINKLAGGADFLKNRPDVAKGKVGVIGFCMGGSLALLMGCRNKAVGAAVPFYGKVPADSALTSLGAPVMYVYAGKDQWITREEVDRLDNLLKKSGNAGQVVRYANADHAFCNDTRKEVYKEDDAKDAWKRAIAFLHKNL